MALRTGTATGATILSKIKGGSSTDNIAQMGSQFKPLYHTRMTKAYIIMTNEFDQLGTMGTLTTVFFSVGLSLWTLAVGIVASLNTGATLNGESQALLSYGPPFLLILGLVCIGLAIWAATKSKSIKDQIISESVPIKI